MEVTITPDEACQKLRQMRDENIRDSELVVEIGERLVRKYSNSFGNEIYLICEQIFLACLDTSRFDLASMCMDILENNFPDSSRVKKLKGIRLEALGEYDKALKIYEEVLEKDETNSGVQKRKVAIYVAKGQNATAIKELSKYLETFMTDQEGWGELADLYIQELEYEKAAFCIEELILMNAYNHLYHLKYAEIKFTQGGTDNLEFSRQYFAQAIRLSNNKSMRALYGFLMTTAKLASGKNSKQVAANYKYSKWAERMISSKYKKLSNSNKGELSHLSDHEMILSNSLKQLTGKVTVPTS